MCYTKFATHLLIIFVVWCSFAGVTEATIQRLDYAGVQFTPTQAIPMLHRPNRSADGLGLECKRVIVRGDLVDTITGVTAPSGVDVTIPSKTGGGGLNTSVELDIFPGGASNGIQEIKLRYLVELAGPDVFKINVLPRPKIDTITVSPPVESITNRTKVTITATGSGLANVRLDRALQNSKFENFQDALVSTNTTYSFSGDAETALTITANNFFNRVITDAGISQSCATAKGSGQLSYTLRKADLAAVKPTRLYRLGPAENCNGQLVRTTQPQFCTALAGALPAPTAQNPHIEQLRNLGGIIYIVTNPSPVSITGSFKVRLESGINILKEDIVNGLEANGHKILSYSRPENRRMLMRDLNCPSCYDLNVAPYNWVDPQYKVTVDVDNQIQEENENNNTALSD